MDPLTIGLGLGSLAVRAAPTIARWLGGETAGEVTEQVSKAARDIFGTDDPEVAQDTAARDPEAWSQFQVRVAEIAAERERAADQAVLEMFRTAVSDVGNARAMATTNGGVLRWGAVVVSAILLSLYGFALVADYLGIAADGAVERNARLLEYLLIAVSSYWLGSSVGSWRNAERLEQRERGARH